MKKLYLTALLCMGSLCIQARGGWETLVNLYNA